MQNFKINSSNFPYIFSGIFLLVSSVFLIVAFAIGYPTIKTKINSDTYTMASRVEINSHKSSEGETLYSSVFFYNVDNKEYSCSTGSSSTSKPNIDNNKIYYKSQNPDYCISEYDFVQNCIFVGMFIIIALPMFFIGLPMFVCVLKGNAKRKRLRKCGQLVKNIPCKILPSNITLNDRPGYIIKLEYHGLKLKSETKFNIDTNRTQADLLIDPLDPNNYFIDFDIAED